MNNRINRIVVMGGSFNPPTVAHQVLMKTAMTAVDANLGYFVPVSDAYLRRKMRHPSYAYKCLIACVRIPKCRYALMR